MRRIPLVLQLMCLRFLPLGMDLMPRAAGPSNTLYIPLLKSSSVEMNQSVVKVFHISH